MHTLKKTFLTLALALALAFVSAEAAQNTGRILIPESKLKFKANDDYTEVTITGCTLTWNDYKSVDRKWIEIPSKIQGIPVTEIGEGAFEGAGQYSYDDNNNVGLWIPDGIKKLGKESFSYSHFCAIRLPEGLKEIPGGSYRGCFDGCRAKSINIPSTVEYIGEKAFYQCRLEEAVIPAGCKISTSAFADSNIKKLTFPKGRIYFEIHSENNHYGNMQDYEYCVPFKDCKNLETIVIPKELDIVYSASPTYLTEKLTLSDFITGDKINASFALQKQLKAVNVRNKYKVEGEEALVLYNKAVSEKKWDQAKSIAQNAYNLFESFRYEGSTYYKEYNEWKERISDVNCILYDKAVSEKNWNQAKSIAQNTYNLFWNNNAEKEYEWKERITDVMCAQYFPALASKILKLDGAFVKKDGVLIYKIELTDDIFRYSFILKDDSGKEVYTIDDNKFSEQFKQKTGVEYKFGDEYHDNNRTYYIYRNATEAELTAYNKNRKDAVKTFFDGIKGNENLVKDRNNLTFKINLPDESCKYDSYNRAYVYYAKDAAGKNQEFTESEFLNFVKEISGYDYQCYGSSYIYRSLTEAELAAYNKNRKDAVKTFFDGISSNGMIGKISGNLSYKIELPSGIYNSKSLNLKDSSGKTISLSESDFIDILKEISGGKYSAYYRSGEFSGIYRSLTESELAAYNKNRKDAVKTFINSIAPTGSVVKAGGSICFDITFPEGSYKNGTIYVNDASGKKQEFKESEFLKLVKEITDFDYNIDYYSSTYVIRRNATEAETAAYNQNRKDAVKAFIEKLTQSGNVVKSGNSLTFDIALPEGSYKNSGSFYANDASGKKQEFTQSEFLSLVKEITGFDYNIDYYSSTYVIRRNATEAETAAYNQNRKDAVKTFLEKSTPNGNLIKGMGRLIFKIDIPDEVYNGNFHVKDEAGKTHDFSSSEFMNLVNELSGFNYSTYSTGNGLYIYRDATKEEIADNKKFAMKAFLQKAEADGKLVKDGKKDIFMIQLASGTYASSQKVLYMVDVTGKELDIPAKDFLTFAKESSGVKYSLVKNKDGTFSLFRDPTKDEKILIAFNEGTLHTNLAAIKFEDKKGVITIKGFTEKKTAFENAGLKAKDVVKKITVKTEDGAEKEISLADLAGLYPVPAKTVTFTVERTEKKNVQTLTFSAAVEWNEKELKKIK